MSRLLSCLLLLLATSLAWPQSGQAPRSMAAVQSEAQADLETALKQLADLQTKIAEENVPLSRQLNQFEDEVLTKRSEYERARRSYENQLVELNVLKSQVKTRTDEIGYLQSLLSEYVGHFQSVLHKSEEPQYVAAIREAQAAMNNADLTPVEKLEKQVALIRTSFDRLKELAGGSTFEGKGLTESGRVEQGMYTLVGPLALFSSVQSQAAGLAQEQSNQPHPVVVHIGPQFELGIRSLTQAGQGELPLDTSLGNALKISATKDSVIDHIKKGGPVMVPILLLGLAAVIICLVKYFQISRIRVASPQDLQLVITYVNRGERDKAVQHAKSIRGPVGEMLQVAIQHVGEKKEFIEEVMYEKMLATKPRLERYMPILALAAATAPLLGLLGTVTGMINTFNMITVFGTGDPKTLAGGISEALITTEFGLVVAIPSLLMHAFVSRKAKGVLGSMERTTVGFINGVPEPTEEKSDYANNLLA